MKFTPQIRLALDPELNLKNDIDRAVLITRPQPLAERSYIYRRLHPTEAVILALMDGQRTLGEVGELWAELTGREPAVGLAEVSRVVDLYTTGNLGEEKILIEIDQPVDGRIQQYDPADFIIPTELVNLTENRLRKPYNVYYLPTLFCPQRCIYCYAKVRPAPETNLLPLARLREIFTELSALGVEVIQFSGGDPLVRKDIMEILAAVFETGMLVDIPTKLGLSYDRALKLKEFGLEKIQISLDSVDPEILNRLVGVSNYHKRISGTLDHLRRAGLLVRVNCVLTPFNAPGVGPLIDYLGQMGNISRITFSPYGRSLFCHRDDLFISEAEVEQVHADVESRAEIYPHMKMAVGGIGAGKKADPEEQQRSWEGRAFCTANRDGFVLLPDGRVTVCEELYDHPAFIIGDLKEQSVMEMWSSPEALALITPDQAATPGGSCKSCKDFMACNSRRGRCWRDVLKSYGWDKPHYPDPRCPLAPPGNRLG